jgi:hypothetical protein
MAANVEDDLDKDDADDDDEVEDMVRYYDDLVFIIDCKFSRELACKSDEYLDDRNYLKIREEQLVILKRLELDFSKMLWI